MNHPEIKFLVRKVNKLLFCRMFSQQYKKDIRVGITSQRRTNTLHLKLLMSEQISFIEVTQL